MLNTLVVSSKKGNITCHPPRSLGEVVINSLVTFVLFVWPRLPCTLPQNLIISSFFFQSIYRTHFYGRCHVHFIKCFDIVTCDLYLTYFVPQGDLCVLYCVYGIELITTRKVFTKLCCF